MGNLKFDYICYFDGACEPRNPSGALGMGAVIYQNDKIIQEYSYFIPAKRENTNNIAEYIAFIRILKWIQETNIIDKNILIRGDSMLVVKQMNDVWNINSGVYVKYAKIARELLKQMNNKITIEWICRDYNSIADNLSKKELINHNIKITVR